MCLSFKEGNFWVWLFFVGGGVFWAPGSWYTGDVHVRCAMATGGKILFKILKDISSSNPLLPHLNVCLGTEHLITSYSTNLCLSPLLSGYGLPDDIVIEKQGKGDNFVDCTGANIKISNLKLIQHDAVEGILSKCKSILNFSWIFYNFLLKLSQGSTLTIYWF